jgi:hypothetical protein
MARCLANIRELSRGQGTTFSGALDSVLGIQIAGHLFLKVRVGVLRDTARDSPHAIFANITRIDSNTKYPPHNW